ncbi:MAG: hypothetical protein DMD26_06325 [Gemmatimonadetes bacterium]|nr:MAG: hypothetical protein DMD26_06325 [Gemmatimonadota bacterium]
MPEALDGAFLNRRPPAPWAAHDPADSLYRVAREALNRGDYRRAAQLFNDLTQRFPNSAYAYVSTYYEAFSRYRIGTTEELRAADRALQALSGRYAAASNGSRDDTDVNGLLTRIRGALAMRGDSDAEITVKAAARQAVVSAAKNDPSVNVRAEAISYLPRMAGDAGLSALEDVLRTSDDERIQRTAVRALMSSESPRARTSLRGLLERRDASEMLRIQVLEAYTKERSTPDDAAFVRSLYNRADSERMKMAVIAAVARIGGKDNQDWLAGLVKNTSESSQLRSAALQRLSRSDVPIADLDRMYDAADSRSMREQLISALASRKEPEATDKLIDIAKNSTDLEMRRLAINYLSRKNDPRATKLLMELIEK